MTKTILITGSTDGIGLEAAKLLAADGHRVLLHGRNPGKLQAAQQAVGGAQGFIGDLSSMASVTALAAEITGSVDRLDVLINNAGILKSPDPKTPDGFDIRFAVNTFAVALLTQCLMPLLGGDARVVSLSSAAQAPVDPKALHGPPMLGEMAAYSQSKLAMTMWSNHMAATHPDGPVFVAVNPGSLLATKMVKEGFGIGGNDIRIGADILVHAALSEEFADVSGKYFDNDAGRFGPPHAHAQDAGKCAEVAGWIEDALTSSGA